MSSWQRILPECCGLKGCDQETSTAGGPSPGADDQIQPVRTNKGIRSEVDLRAQSLPPMDMIVASTLAFAEGHVLLLQ